jgi:membrane protease subunit HflC
MRKFTIGLAVGLVVILIGVTQALFTVDETQFAVVTRFGDIQRSVTNPGLNFKSPLVEQVTRFDKRLLRVDVPPASMPDKESQFLEIDAYTRYRIVDPEKFWRRLRDESTAANRISNIVISEIRQRVAASTREDIIGGVITKLSDGTVVVEARKAADGYDTRAALMNKVLAGANAAVTSQANDYGISIHDVRIKRADFPTAVEQTVFNRMRTERDVQAKKYRADGEEEYLTISADVDRQTTIIRADADMQSNELRGEGEAKAIRIFASALESDPEFFAFRRSLEAYTKFLTQNTTVVLSADNDLFQYLQNPAGRTETPEQ